MKDDNFELKLNEIKQIIEKLNEPDITLADSMKFYKDGLKSLKDATKMLEDAKLILNEEEDL